MAKTSVTFEAFSALSSSDGTFKTWGDMTDGGYLENLVNSEVLGNVLRAPQEITGDNIWFQYKVFPKGRVQDKTNASKVPVLNRVMFNLPDKRDSFDYLIDRFGEKEVKDWSFWLGVEDSNIYKQSLNHNNIVVLRAVYDYCIATGQVKVLSNLGTAGKTPQNYFDDTALIADSANAVMSTQTAVALGINPERINIFTAPNVMRQMTTGLAGVNVSQGAYNDIKLGRISNLFGYNFDRSIYLGKSIEAIEGKGVDLSNVLGMLYSRDSVGFYQQSLKWVLTPLNQMELQRACAWKPFAAVIPSRENTTFLYAKTFPTIEEINAKRAQLLKEQPGAYAKLPGGALNVITADEYTALRALSTNFDAAFEPNVELPAAERNANSLEETKKGLFNKNK